MRSLLILMMTLLLGGFAIAQDDPIQKQERARLKFTELHERMQKLQATLASSEPEQSKTLGVGNRHIQETALHEKLRTAKELLDGQHWDEALTKMEEVRKDLDRLLDVLMNRDTDLKKLLEEIARLEGYLKRVDQLAKDQQAEKEQAAKSEALSEQLKSIAAAKQKLDEIAANQKALQENARKGDQPAPLAEKQADLKSEADKLEEQLEKLEKAAKDLAPKDKKDSDGGKAGESKDGEKKDADGKTGEGSCSGSMGQAGESMQSSQQKLQSAQQERAIQDMQKALDALEAAKKKLDKLAEDANRELLALPFEQQAKKQEVTQVDTDKLAQDMEKGEKSENGEKQETPGKQNIQNAVPKQKAAAGQLKEFKPGKAKQDQQDAKDQLDEAKRKLEDALAQLRQELQDDVLRSLEERFGAMLAKQKELSARTKLTERLRSESLAASAELPEALVTRIAELAAGESELAIDAADAQKLLEEEGTTAVFPEMVAELKEGLNGVTGMLRAQKTGTPTQERQAEVEEMLKMLIDSLRKTIETKENGGECGH